MRKIFTNLKSVVALAVVAAMTLSVSCMYDDTALTKRVNKVETNLAALTERVEALENNAAIKALLDGAAVVTGVTADEAGNTVLTLSNGESLTVVNGVKYRVVDGVLELSADGETWVAVSASADSVVESAVVGAAVVASAAVVAVSPPLPLSHAIAAKQSTIASISAKNFFIAILPFGLSLIKNARAHRKRRSVRRTPSRIC